MASLRIFCLVLLFSSILTYREARPLTSRFSSSDRRHDFAGTGSAKKLLKEILVRKQLLGTHYEPNRLSPGGPDPTHH
ncbi:hypothetical protein Fmac_020209 [Flemingia macrophylla]|uniref:Uncharacterized protein n=1 Tax=Flemingia macrophylla TaxID=520843 RepID=A0ABD1LTC6_9FABA